MKLRALIRRSLRSLAGTANARDAWARFVRPGELIGLKVNCLAGPHASTRPEVAYAVAAELIEAGHPAENIIIWDRSERELKRIGYELKRQGQGPLCFATDSSGYGYDGDLYMAGTVGSLFSRLLLRLDAVINLPVLKDHGLAGVSLGMKNYYGVIHNPNKYHENLCNPYVADLCSSKLIRRLNRLTIIDGLTGLCHGGPAYFSQWSWPWGGIIMGSDQVAVDRIGWDVIDRRRGEAGLPSLAEAEREPSWIFTAADPEHDLGEAELDRIRVVEA
jgi:uncharacterized protein (DUF362 family)